MNRILQTAVLFISLFLLTEKSISQTTAMDFTVNDCNGNSHHLFSELDAGKVIILDFVMMNCSSCIDATNGLKSLTAPYATSHPGQVQIYTFGYTNSINCTQMQAWMSAFGFSHTCFSGDDAQVTYYGGMGMPTIAVVGTNAHKVLFTKLGYEPSDNAAITAAIETGLQANGIGDLSNAGFVSVFASQGKVMLQLNKVTSGLISISDLQGRKVFGQSFENQEKVEIATESWIAGMYAITVTNKEGQTYTSKFLIN